MHWHWNTTKVQEKYGNLSKLLLLSKTISSFEHRQWHWSFSRALNRSTDYVHCIVYAKKIVILISSRGFLCYLELKTEIPIRTILELFIMYSCTMTLDLMEMHLWLQTFWRTQRNLMMSVFSVIVICFVSVIQLLSTLQLFQYIISEKITLWRIDPSDEKWTVFQSRLYYA